MCHVVPGPRAEGAQGPGPAAHPRRRQPGPALHLRRRPRPRHPPRDGVATRPSTTTSTSRPPPPPRSSSWPRRSGARSTADGRAVPLRVATRPSSTTSSCACRTSARPARSSGSRPRPRSTRCSTRSSPGSATSRRPGGCDPPPARALRSALRRARGQRQGRRLARDRPVPAAVHRPDGAGPRPRLRPRPLHPLGRRVGALGHRHPGRARRRCPPDVRFVQGSGLDLALARADGATSGPCS